MQSSNSTESKILSVAKEMFLDRGIMYTDMKDIAQELNCSRSTLYRYFTSKADILFVLAVDALKIFNDATEIPEGYRFINGYESFEWQINSLVECLIGHRDEVAFIRDFDCVFTKDYPESLNGESFENFENMVRRSTYTGSPQKNFEIGMQDGSIKKFDNPELVVLSIIQSCFAIAQRIMPREAIYVDEYGYGQEMLRCHTKLLLESLKNY